MLKWDPLSDWDRRIMETLPYVADIARFSEFDEVKVWLSSNVDYSDYAWKSYRFFFRNRDDYVLFTMRWG